MEVETERGRTSVEVSMLPNVTSTLPQGHGDREGEESSHFCVTKHARQKIGMCSIKERVNQASLRKWLWWLGNEESGLWHDILNNWKSSTHLT